MFQEVNRAIHSHAMKTGEKPKNIFLGKSEKIQLEKIFSIYGIYNQDENSAVTDCDFTLLGMNGYFVSAKSLLRVAN